MKDKSMYILEELNRLHLSSTFAGNKLKKFQPQLQLHLDYIPNLDYEELSNLEEFF